MLPGTTEDWTLEVVSPVVGAAMGGVSSVAFGFVVQAASASSAATEVNLRVFEIVSINPDSAKGACSIRAQRSTQNRGDGRTVSLTCDRAKRSKSIRTLETYALLDQGRPCR